MVRLTDHFTFDEMTDSRKFPELVDQNRRDALGFMKQLKYITGTLEEIREVLGVPMTITSGYRNGALNKAAGGSATSGHTKGLCADFQPIGLEISHAFNMIQANKSKCPSLKKCIYESINGSKWLHIETKTEANQPQQFFTTNNGKTYTEIKA